MQTIQSRLYTNAILTAIAIFLAVIAFKPLFNLSTPSYAQTRRSSLGEPRNQQQREAFATLEGAQYREVAAATEKVADATREISLAIREAAKSQKDIAKAISKLGDI